MRFGSGSRALYEGAKANAVGLNGWAEEYLRGRVRAGDGRLRPPPHRALPPRPRRPLVGPGEGSGEPVPLLRRPRWSHAWLIEQFLDWREGGPPMATNVEDNLRSAALSHAAIESGHSGRPVRVDEVLRRAREAVLSRSP
jgi:predicted dehydrogenase